jgi:hypothetical protein
VHEQVRGDVGATQRRRTPVPEGGRLVRDGQSGVIPAPPAELIQWAQVLAPIIAAFAAFAAVASWRSAKASLRTAGRADDTARRSAEALSRSTRPDFTGMLAQTDERTTAPQPMTLYLLNRTPHRGRILSARVETPDGTVLGRPGCPRGHHAGRADHDDSAALAECAVAVASVAVPLNASTPIAAAAPTRTLVPRPVCLPLFTMFLT